MADNEKIATAVIEAVGGLGNVAGVQHCMTRLRFNLKDDSNIDDERVKKIEGVQGVMRRGGQYQVIIGTNVSEVYDAAVALGLHADGEVDENPSGAKDGVKLDLTPSGVGNAILDYLSGSVVPLIPVLITGALFQTLGTVLGPTVLNVVSAESDFSLLCTQVYNAAFYFLPIIAGYSAARKLGANPFLGAFMGAILMEPSFAALASQEGATFSVLGIPAPVANYSQTLIPVLLSVVLLARVQQFFERVLPEAIRTIFAPFFTMFVMMPFSLCLLAPIGNWVGEGIAALFMWIAATPFKPFAVALISALWGFLVVTGMHLGIAAIALAQYAVAGQDTLVLLGANISNFVCSACALAVFFRLKHSDNKVLTMGYIVTHVFGGVGEPLYYGVHFRYRSPWVGQFVGGFFGGLYAALTGVINYSPIQGFFTPLGFLGGTTSNFVNACIAMAISCIVAFAVTYIVCRNPDGDPIKTVGTDK